MLKNSVHRGDPPQEKLSRDSKCKLLRNKPNFPDNTETTFSYGGMLLKTPGFESHNKT